MRALRFVALLTPLLSGEVTEVATLGEVVGSSAA